MLLGYVLGMMFLVGFVYIVGGYGVGYYGYLWSLVVVMDLCMVFVVDKFDLDVGWCYCE